jgi:ribose transport system substrate-binding protein
MSAVKSQLKEFKVVSTGEDLVAQIAVANNFIDSGYDAVIINALNPAAFAPVALVNGFIGTLWLF